MKRFHYSIFVCFICSLAVFCTIGLMSGTMSIYLPYMIQNGNLTSTQGSSLLTLRSLTSLITILFLVDRLYKKVSLRNGITLALILGAFDFFLYGVSQSYVHYGIAMALTGLVYGIGGIIPVSVLLNRWFKSHGALAVGICMAGSGLATIIVPPVFVFFVNKLSLRWAFYSLGIFLIIIAIMSFIIIRDHPSDMGLLPFEEEDKKKVSDSSAAGFRPDRGIVYLVLLASLLTGAATNSINQHAGVLFRTLGFDEVTISLMISLGGISLTMGKMIFGYISDKKGGKTAYTWFGLLLMTGAGFSVLSRPSWMTLSYVTVCIMYMGSTLSTVGVTVIAKDMSGEDTYAHMLKNCQSAAMAGATFFTLIPGIIADYTGSYIPAYLMMVVLELCATVMIRICYKHKEKKIMFYHVQYERKRK